MSAARAELDRLRTELEARFGDAILPGGTPRPAREERSGFRIGVGPLDQLLPHGVPRGAISLWTGETTSGRTAALRALVERSCAEGAVVALVDATRSLDASFGCAGEERIPGLWLVRPPGEGHEREGAWAAEALLRTGVFDLVVLDGHAPEAAQAHRLRALAREHAAALVVSVEMETAAAGQGWRADLRLEFRRARGTAGGGLLPGGRFRRWTRLREGNGGEREVELVYEPADRLHPGPTPPDRRPRAR